MTRAQVGHRQKEQVCVPDDVEALLVRDIAVEPDDASLRDCTVGVAQASHEVDLEELPQRRLTLEQALDRLQEIEVGPRQDVDVSHRSADHLSQEQSAPV